MKKLIKVVLSVLISLSLIGVLAAQTGGPAKNSEIEKKELALGFALQALHLLFENRCDQFISALNEPFFMLSHGEIPREKYGAFICDDTKDLLARFGWENYLAFYQPDIYSFTEFDSVVDSHGRTIGLKKVLSTAPHRYEITENDFFFFGGRLKEGATQQGQLNFGWTGFIIRRTASGVFVISGVID